MCARTCSTALLGLLVLACSGASEPPVPAQAPVAPPVVVAAPVPAPTQPTWLYEVHTDSQPSYVFAALDPGCPLHEAFPSDYLVLFRYARQVIVINAQSNDEAAALLLARGIDRSGSLPRSIGAEPFAQLTGVIDDAVPAPMVRLLRPEWALLALSQALAADAYGVGASDARISPTHDGVSRREMGGAPVVGLFDDDAVESSLDAMAPLATETLRAMLAHLDDERASARSRLAAYRAGDEAALLTEHGHVTPGTERLAAASVAETARALDDHTATIETELRGGNALVLLSYDMVLGEHGLLARLRTDGFEVSRISMPAAE